MNRGVNTLKNLKITFCDFGGSSKGFRDFLKTQEFYDFVNSNKKINFDFMLKRGHHPVIRAEFNNGYEKDISLRNFNQIQVIQELKKLKEQIGHRAIKHAGYKVYSNNKSIQGPWVSNMWNSFPQHGILEFKTIPKYFISKDDFIDKKPYVERKFPETYTQRFRKRKTTFDSV